MSYTTSYSVMSEVHRRSDDGCSRFFRTYAPLIRLHGRDCGVPEEELDDLVQNVMTEFFRNDAFVYDAARGSFRSYLRRIIRRRSNDILRRIYRARRLNDALMPREEYLDRRYDEEWSKYVRAEALRRLRGRVDARHYQQFCMLALQERDVRSVARFFGVPVSSIYCSFHRTRELMAAIVKEVEASCGY